MFLSFFRKTRTAGGLFLFFVVAEVDRVGRKVFYAGAFLVEMRRVGQQAFKGIKSVVFANGQRDRLPQRAGLIDGRDQLDGIAAVRAGDERARPCFQRALEVVDLAGVAFIRQVGQRLLAGVQLRFQRFVPFGEAVFL